MEIPKQYDFQRYLAAKQSVEQRAQNGHVWAGLVAAIESLQGPVRVLELGAGIGSMALRFAEAGLLDGAEYTLVEPDTISLDVARERLASAGEGEFHFVAADAYEFLSETEGNWDLVVAHALLDLLDLERALPAFLGALRAGGLFYFPVNYDGLTIFEPVEDAEFEEQLMAAFHQTMDARQSGGRPSGDSRTGRHLLKRLPELGAKVLAAGASDWVVVPQSGGYMENEAYFLYHILHFFETSLQGHADVDSAKLADWLTARRRQIAEGELVYIAHQLDVVGRKAA
ncbi:MAG: class I SAM-dependent methyltransferase [Chloroflexi bacterium]|nr:class I SAM-dependent methyltransferase [Chloroflexota bacterium]